MVWHKPQQRNFFDYNQLKGERDGEKNKSGKVTNNDTSKKKKLLVTATTIASDCKET